MLKQERHRYNKAISSPRMKIKHVIRRVKNFKVTATEITAGSLPYGSVLFAGL